MFLCYSDSSHKSYWKNCCLEDFLILGVSFYLHKLGIYVPDAGTSCRMMYLVESSFHVRNFFLPEKNPKTKDFALLTQIFKLLFWGPKIVKIFIVVTQWVIAYLQSDSKRPTVNFLRQSDIYKKQKKDEVLCMLFRITQIWFNESDYVTLYSIVTIMTENGAKARYKTLQLWF